MEWLRHTVLAAFVSNQSRNYNRMFRCSRAFSAPYKDARAETRPCRGQSPSRIPRHLSCQWGMDLLRYPVCDHNWNCSGNLHKSASVLTTRTKLLTKSDRVYPLHSLSWSYSGYLGSTTDHNQKYVSIHSDEAQGAMGVA